MQAQDGLEGMDATAQRAAMLAHLRESAFLCGAYGSPFTAGLITRLAEDYEAGGPVTQLLERWPAHPRADAVSVRLTGALHAAALQGLDPALAAQYPEQRSAWDLDALWPVARAFLVRERDWVARFIRSAPQTNEVRRSIVLLLGFLWLARETGLPLETLEIGASAGLNLHWDRFAYRTATWSWGPQHGVVVDTEWIGRPPPLDAAVHVRSRAACDLNPLDITDPAQRLQLRSYIWADQHARLERFDAAAGLAIERGVRVERADAAAWLAGQLERPRAGATTIVYHSVFLQYPPRETREAIQSAIESAGARATRQAPLAWLRMEPEASLGGPRDSVRFLLDVVTWPGAERRILAITDGHARSVEVVADRSA